MGKFICQRFANPVALVDWHRFDMRLPHNIINGHRAYRPTCRYDKDARHIQILCFRLFRHALAHVGIEIAFAQTD